LAQDEYNIAKRQLESLRDNLMAAFESSDDATP
jgi:hypothetical protein